MSLIQFEADIGLGDYRDASDVAQVLLSHPWVTTSPELEAMAHLAASRACRMLADQEGARAAVRRALDLTDLTGETHTASEVRARALIAALAAGLEPRSLWLSELREAVVSWHDPSVRSLIAWTLGNESFHDGDAEAGVRWHDEADALLTPAVDFRNWARFARATASQRVAANVDDRVDEFIDRARKSLALLGNSDELADLAITEAVWHTKHSRPDAAFEALELALSRPGVPKRPLGHLHLALARLEDRPLPERIDAATRAAQRLTEAGALDEALTAWNLRDTLLDSTP